MASPFQPLNMGEVYRNAEAIRSLKSNTLNDQLQREYLRDVRIPNEQADASRAVAQESRAAQSHTSEQTIVALRTLNAAAAEIAANPQAAQRWLPQLKSVGIPVEQLGPLDQAAAAQLFQDTSKALQAFDGSNSQPNNVQSTHVLDNGNIGIVMRDGSVRDTGQRAKPQIVVRDVNGVPTVVTATGTETSVSPLSTVDEEAGARAQIAGAEQTAREEAGAVAEQNKELTANQRTLEVWGVAKQGLVRALAGTSTGPVQGRLPAVTSGQQIAEGAVAAVAPVLKQLFRSAGEGVFTDRDQQLLLEMVPNREDHPETVKAKIDMIDAIIQAKLSASIPGDTPQSSDSQAVPQGVDPSLWQFMTPEERALWQ